jgi:hypothetical protein
MRNISFSATTEQVRNRQKFVTRRLIHPKKRSIWQNLKPDEHLMGIEKGQGLKKGEKVKRITEIVVLDATPEPLDEIIRFPMRSINPYALQPVWWADETTLEGFPELTPLQFVKMFMEMNKCDEDAPVVRILFDYVDENRDTIASGKNVFMLGDGK